LKIGRGVTQELDKSHFQARYCVYGSALDCESYRLFDQPCRKLSLKQLPAKDQKPSAYKTIPHNHGARLLCRLESARQHLRRSEWLWWNGINVLIATLPLLSHHARLLLSRPSTEEPSKNSHISAPYVTGPNPRTLAVVVPPARPAQLLCFVSSQ
jgi:hypothetical protein